MAQNSGAYYAREQEQFRQQSMGTETLYNPVVGGPAYSQQAAVQVAYPAGYAMAPAFGGGYPVALGLPDPKRSK